MRICVIGAGIVGTSSAIRLKKAFPNADLELVSDSFSPHTTSDGSGGFWQPHLLRDTPAHSVQKWSRETFQLCENLWRQDFSNSDLQGLESLGQAVALLPCYDLMKDSQQEVAGDWKSIVYDYRWMTADETSRLGFARNMVGHSFLSYVYEPALALPIMYAWLRKQPKVKLVSTKLTSLDELLHQNIDLVVNCTGSGAKYFVGDDNIKPISGHVLRVKAPWLHFVMASADDIYVIPNRDAVVVGAVNQFNNWSMETNTEDARMILQRCAQTLCPRLKDAQILSQWVGLRPFRLGGVRVEHEHYKEKLHVIHNYGHGGCGVTLSWGCAKQVVELAKPILTSSGTSNL